MKITLIVFFDSGRVIQQSFFLDYLLKVSSETEVTHWMLLYLNSRRSVIESGLQVSFSPLYSTHKHGMSITHSKFSEGGRNNARGSKES